MQVIIHGQQMEVGEALQTYVTEKMQENSQKFFNHAVQAQVHFVREAGSAFRSDITLAVGNGIVLKATGTSAEAYPAFDQAAHKLTSQLKRYKNRLRDHHKRLDDKGLNLGKPANQYVLQAEPEHAEGNQPHDHSEHQPLVIAETTTLVPTLSVAEAVMRLDLEDTHALMFYHSGHGGLNLVYRRADGHIGWLDPQGK